MLTPSEMKDHLHRLVREGDFIEGIYNYCDRWCEKCMFTNRCLNFESGKDAPDADSPDLFEYIGNVFEATKLMLDEKMKEMGIDPSEIDKIEIPDEPDPKDHPLHQKAFKTAMVMHKWLEIYNLSEKIPDDTTLVLSEKTLYFKQAIEVIYWYNFFVSAKIYRALIRDDINEPGEIQTDSNGSAKIALIALDRLIGAWSIVMENFNDQEDNILSFLISMAEIRKQTEITFPLARSFVRPGFDN